MMELKGKRGNMSYDDIKKLLEENNQEHLLKYYDELNDTQKANLLDQISKLDFSLIDLIKNKEHSGDKGVITPLDDAVSIKNIEENREKFTAVGADAIKKDLVQISQRACTTLVKQKMFIFLKCLLEI